LDDRSMARLRELPPGVIDGLIADFHPSEGCDNLNAKFLGFLKSRSGDVKGDGKRSQRDTRNAGEERYRDEHDTIESFGLQWGLSKDALNHLRDAGKEVQEKVMAIFNPPDQDCDVNARFMSFLALQQKPTCPHWAKGSCTYGSSCKFRHAHATGAEAAPSYGRGQARDDHEPGEWAKRDDHSAFAEKWGLDDAAMDRLRALPWDEQKDAMASFNPREGCSSSHINAKFVVFLRQRKSGSYGYAKQEATHSKKAWGKTWSDGHADQDKVLHAFKESKSNTARSKTAWVDRHAEKEEVVAPWKRARR